MKAKHLKGMSKKPDRNSKVAQETQKVSLKATKIPVRKIGMNSGIDGGSYQCC